MDECPLEMLMERGYDPMEINNIYEGFKQQYHKQHEKEYHSCFTHIDIASYYKTRENAFVRFVKENYEDKHNG